MALNREMLLAYQEKWQAVAQFEKEEQQAATVSERWQRLNALVRLAGALALRRDDNDSIADASYERWNRLRSLYHRENEDAQL
jgi:hypothetical protein